MDKTKLEKLVRLSGRATAKALAALERRGYDSVQSCLRRSVEFHADRLHRSQNRRNEH